MDHLSKLKILFILITMLSLLFFGRGINQARKRIDTDLGKKIYQLFSLFALVWVGVLWALSASGFFSDFTSIPPRLLLVLLVPLIFLIVILRINTTNNTINQLLQNIPLSWLTTFQVFRVGVELLLWYMFVANFLPEILTFEGNNWDVLVGLSGPIIGMLVFRNKKTNKKLGIIWNCIGLLLLLNVVVTAILSFPTPFQLIKNEVSNEIITTFPFVFLPGVLVPLAYFSHVLSIKQIIHREK